MQNQTIAPQRRDLIYSGKVNKQKHHLFKVDKQFLQDLQTEGQLIIEGEPEDQLIINSNNNSYRLKGINISTTILVINPIGIIQQEANSYLEVQKYDPLFHQIYKRINSLSCQSPDKEGIKTFEELISNYSFTQYSVRKQCYLNEQNFIKLANAMNLVKLNQTMEIEDCRYLYINIHFATWIMRKIVDIYNGFGKSLFEPITYQQLLENFPLMNTDILEWIAKYFEFVSQEQQNTKTIKMTAKSIIRFIVCEMAIAKKQYSLHTFSQILDEMVVVYMPAQAQITSAQLKQQNKDKQNLFSCIYDYFIELKDDKYIYYDYMDIQSQWSGRLKFLNGFKKRWKATELKTIFRGIQGSQNGKPFLLSDILLKKFRKYGQEYEIKFILPNK